MNKNRSPRGGNRRALYPTQYEAPAIGVAVLKEMYGDCSAFRSRLDGIGLRYRRVIRVIAPNSPPLDALPNRLKALEVARPVHYPRRVPAAAALADWERRATIIDAAE